MRAYVLCLVTVACVIIVPAVTHSGEGSGEDKGERKEQEELSSFSEHEGKSSGQNPGSSTSTASRPPPKESSTSLFTTFSLGNIPTQIASLRERIPTQTANLRERARQITYNAAGVLYDTAHPVREDLKRQAFSTASALYQTGAPVRKAVEDSLVVKTGDHVRNAVEDSQVVKTGDPVRKAVEDSKVVKTGDPVRKAVEDSQVVKTGDPVKKAVEDSQVVKTGDPVRKAVEDSKVVKASENVWKITSQLQMKGKTREERIGTLVHALSEEIVNHVPLYTKIRPLEVKDGVRFFCGVKGLMKDLRTMKKVETIVEPLEDDGLRIKIDYTFTDLHFSYTKFHIHGLQGLGMQQLSADGWLALIFAENNIRITLQIPKFTQIIKNLVEKRCIVLVSNFEVTNLVFVKSTLSGRKESKRRKFLSGRIKSYLFKNQDFLRAIFEQQALMNIHHALVTQDNWVCKDKGFDDLVKSKGGSLDDFVPQNLKEFNQYCGTDYYIEPYKKPQEEEELDSSAL